MAIATHLTQRRADPRTATRKDQPTHMGSLMIYRPSAERAYRHTLAEDVAKRPVRPRRRLFRR